jgi:hypothetical protein
VEIAGEQRLVEAVDRLQLCGAGGGQGDIAIDKVAGVLANSIKIMKEASSSIGSVCSKRLRMKFFMTVSHQPPVNPAARGFT